MHYKNGREAKVGDRILVTDYQKQPWIGLIISITPGSTSCNAQVLPLPNYSAQAATLGECLHVEDALIPATEVRADGSAPPSS